MAQSGSELTGLGTARGSNVISTAAALSLEEIKSLLDRAFAEKAAAEGTIVVLLGEIDRRMGYSDEGATALEPWAVERFGVSLPTARAYGRLCERAADLPHLMGSLCAGEMSLDKVRAVAEVATPESDRELCHQAKEHSVRELVDFARMSAERSNAGAGGVTSSRPGHQRGSVRFNDQCRTVMAQLPPESYAETRACLEARARQVPSDGETPWDNRLCDAFLELIRSGAGDGSSRASTASPYVVVAHVPLAALVDTSTETSELACELERGGLVDVETARRLACDATIVVALDDDVGHTMYEGRSKREPTSAQRREVLRRDRHCRFPGCNAVTFTQVHHVIPWKPDGRTDLDNLALMCEFHHHQVHARGWTMSGNANEELHIVGPTGRIMTSRPSPLWTRVTSTGRR